MVSTTTLIRLEQEQSVQVLPDVNKNGASINRFMSQTKRGPLLPAHGSRERERTLLEFWRDDYDTIFPGAIAGLAKRVISSPWQITGDDRLAQYFQTVFMAADFGSGWGTFINKLVTDYSRYDAGAYIELTAPGDPREPINSAITGLSILDSLRCLPTGDPNYPVVYMDIYGAMHIMHHTRVIRFVDGMDSDETSYGYGQCSLTRAIAPVSRDILINRYVQTTLDDNPAPGIMILKNITDGQLTNAIAKMEQERSTDFGGQWGRTIKLFGMLGDQVPEVSHVSFSSPPERFDLEKYKQQNAREIALSIGVDIQDIWDMQQNGLGSGTQSEILHAKSKGKGSRAHPERT